MKHHTCRFGWTCIVFSASILTTSITSTAVFIFYEVQENAIASLLLIVNTRDGSMATTKQVVPFYEQQFRDVPYLFDQTDMTVVVRNYRHCTRSCMETWVVTDSLSRIMNKALRRPWWGYSIWRPSQLLCAWSCYRHGANRVLTESAASLMFFFDFLFYVFKHKDSRRERNFTAK